MSSSQMHLSHCLHFQHSNFLPLPFKQPPCVSLGMLPWLRSALSFYPKAFLNKSRNVLYVLFTKCH
jgi:hypothetical protein